MNKRKYIFLFGISLALILVVLSLLSIVKADDFVNGFNPGTGIVKEGGLVPLNYVGGVMCENYHCSYRMEINNSGVVGEISQTLDYRVEAGENYEVIMASSVGLPTYLIYYDISVDGWGNWQNTTLPCKNCTFFPGDYDGDGASDILGFSSQEKKGYFLLSSNWSTNWYDFTIPDCSNTASNCNLLPITGDFDGDKKSDLVAYDSSSGYLAWLLSSNNYSLPWGYAQTPRNNFQFISGDYNADNVSDFVGFAPHACVPNCMGKTYPANDGCGGACKVLPSVEYSGSKLYIYPTDNSAGAAWGCSETSISTAQSETDGSANTLAIVAGCSTANAAKICSDLNFEGYSDWYLPAKTQLSTMYDQWKINNVTKGDYSSGWANYLGSYWSSTEYSADPAAAMRIDVGNGDSSPFTKSTIYRVRCVRDDVDAVTGTDGGLANSLYYDFSPFALGWNYVDMPFCDDCKFFPGDYNGDKVSDLIAFSNQTRKLYWALSILSYPNETSDSGEEETTDAIDTLAPTVNWEPFNSIDLPLCPAGEDCNALPISGDFDGDNKSDIVIYTAQTGNVVFSLSSAGFLSYGGAFDTPCKNCSIIPGDYDGDKISDLMLYYSYARIPRPLTVTIDSPKNETYKTEIPTSIDYTIFGGVDLVSCEYSTDHGVTNHTTVCSDRKVNGLTPVEGSNTWTILAKNSAGTISSSSVTFVVNTSASLTPNIIITYPQNITYETSVKSMTYTVTGLGSANNNLPYVIYNGKHLELQPTDISSGVVWSPTYNTTIAQSSTNGSNNTIIITNYYGAGTYAADLCSASTLGGYSDWYLPSLDQLYSIYLKNNSLPKGDYSTEWVNLSFVAGISDYWSSTEVSDEVVPSESSAWGLTFSNGAESRFSKNEMFRVRCVRDETSQVVVPYSCWYSTELGIRNNIACGTTINDITSHLGTNVWQVGANNSIGNVNSTWVIFVDNNRTRTDITSPAISFISPTEESGIIQRENIQVKVNVSDNAELSTLAIRLYNSTGLVNLTSISLNSLKNSTRFINFTNLHGRTYYFNATVCDTSNNCNNTATRNISINMKVPSIIIIYPQNITYSTEVKSINYSISNLGLEGGELPYIYDNGSKLYISPIDNSTNAIWGCSGKAIGSNAQSEKNGSKNTAAIVSGCTTAGIAAKLCNDYNFGGYSDWYLPAEDQLSKIYIQWSINNVTIDETYTTPWADFISSDYWSSTEIVDTPTNGAFSVDFEDGEMLYANKGHHTLVRCVRDETSQISNLASCWYSTDNGITNQTITCGNNITGLSSEMEESNTWKIWASYTTGNINSSSVTFADDRSGIIPDTEIPTAAYISSSTEIPGIINKTNIQVNVSASDDRSLSSITIRLYNSTSLINSTTHTTTGKTSSYFINFVSLTNGTYRFNATACDTSNNCANLSRRTIIINTSLPAMTDTTIPTISFVSPTDTSGIINKTNIQVNVSASDNFELDYITINLYNSTSLINSTTGTTASHFINFTDLAGGIYYFNATACDIFDNCANTGTRGVKIDTSSPTIPDTAAPTIAFITPPTEDVAIKRTNIQVMFNASDDTILTKVIVKLQNAAGIINSTSVLVNPVKSVVYFINFTNLGNGEHTFSVIAYDLAGNEEVEARTILINTSISGLDTVRPSIYFVSPTDDSSTLNRTVIRVNVTASDQNLKNITIYLYNSARNVVDSDPFSVNPTTSQAYTEFSGLTNGIYYFNATACDVLNNCAGTTITKTVIINTSFVDITAPSITSVEPTVSPYRQSGSGITFNYHVSDLSNIASCRLSLKSNTSTITNTTTWIVKSDEQSFSHSLSVGNYSWNITCTDSFGNSATSDTRLFIRTNGGCGDLVCDEDCSSCSRDCGSCNNPNGHCGDEECNNGETSSTCARDCGGVTYVGGYPIYTISASDFQTGYTRQVMPNSIFKFTIGISDYTVKLLSLTSTIATIVVQGKGSPQLETLNIGGEKKFELTGDSNYDLSVKLTGITDNSNPNLRRATLTLKLINERFSPVNVTPVACTPNWNCEWSECFEGKQDKQCSDANNCGKQDGKPAAQERECDSGSWTQKQYIIFIVVLLISIVILAGIIFLVWWFIKKKGNESNKPSTSSMPGNRPPFLLPGNKPLLPHENKPFMITNEAKTFVSNARKKGYPDSEIRKMFIKKGWKSSDIDRLLW